MNNLVIKDFQLSISKFFILGMPLLTGLLFLIPQWPFFIALMYFFFISIPNIFSSYNAQNDFGFSIMMPVGKREIVKGKFISLIIIELTHLAFGALFAFIHVRLYGNENFLMDLNPAFFGIAFMMFGLFNFIFFILYFKTAYSFGIPTIAANIGVFLFIAGVEFLVLFNKTFSACLEGTDQQMRLFQIFILFAGILLFGILNWLGSRISAARFEKIDL